MNKNETDNVIEIMTEDMDRQFLLRSLRPNLMRRGFSLYLSKSRSKRSVTSETFADSFSSGGDDEDIMPDCSNGDTGEDAATAGSSEEDVLSVAPSTITSQTISDNERRISSLASTSTTRESRRNLLRRAFSIGNRINYNGGSSRSLVGCDTNSRSSRRLVGPQKTVRIISEASVVVPSPSPLSEQELQDAFWSKKELHALQTQSRQVYTRATRNDPQLASCLLYCQERDGPIPSTVVGISGVSNPSQHVALDAAIKYVYFYEIRHKNQDEDEVGDDDDRQHDDDDAKGARPPPPDEQSPAEETKGPWFETVKSTNPRTTLRGLERYIAPSLVESRKQTIQDVLAIQRKLQPYTKGKPQQLASSSSAAAGVVMGQSPSTTTKSLQQEQEHVLPTTSYEERAQVLSIKGIFGDV